LLDQKYVCGKRPLSVTAHLSKLLFANAGNLLLGSLGKFGYSKNVEEMTFL